ncbi:MAG: periplasmic heavy metal sensor [Thermodesulfobacteriota bacterium]
MKTSRILISTLAIFLLMAGASQARPGMGHAGPMAMGMGPMWWQNPQVSDKLQLSKEQEAKLTAHAKQSRPAMIDLKAEVDKALFAFETAMATDFNEAEANKKLKSFLKAKNELLTARMANLVATRKILSLEQFKTLRAMRQMHRGKGGRKGGPAAGPRSGGQRGN